MIREQVRPAVSHAPNGKPMRHIPFMRARCVSARSGTGRHAPDGVRRRRALIRKNSTLRQDRAPPGKDSIPLLKRVSAVRFCPGAPQLNGLRPGHSGSEAVRFPGGPTRGSVVCVTDAGPGVRAGSNAQDLWIDLGKGASRNAEVIPPRVVDFWSSSRPALARGSGRHTRAERSQQRWNHRGRLPHGRRRPRGRQEGPRVSRTGICRSIHAASRNSSNSAWTSPGGR